MIPPFESHPMVKQFNWLKKYFLKHQSKESHARILEFRKYSKVIKQLGLDVAFDFVGSMNFGQVVQYSDVDFVLYIECETYHVDCIASECPMYKRIRSQLLESLVKDYPNHPYKIQIIDCLNLKVLMDDLILENIESDTLIRFAFYRSIGRSINSRLLRPYQSRLMQNKNLMESLRPNVDLIFDFLAKNYKHTLSMKKYQERLQDDGVHIPKKIRDRLHQHLNKNE